MHFHPKLALAALAAAALLATAVATTSANRLSVSERQFQILWSVPLSGGGGGDIRAECPLTLQGSFHSSTIRKVLGSLIGQINNARAGPAETCVTGAMTVLAATLPWHVTYQGFTGLLPNLSSVRIYNIGAGFQIRESAFGEVCLFRTSAANPAGLIANLSTTTGAVTGVRADESLLIPMTGGFACELSESEANFTGIGSMTTLTGREIFIDLI